MKNIIAIFGFLSLLTFTSCNVVNVTADYDRQADFNTYKTYSFHQKGIEKLDINDLDKRRIIAAIEQNLAAKGFIKVTSDPDLLVNLLASSTKEVDVNDNWYGYGYGPYGYYGGYWGGGYPTVSEYTAGKIVIDIVDDKRNILVWQGIGSGLNLSNVSSKADRIPKAIDEILSKFPPQKK
jgi:hypothetical protein